MISLIGRRSPGGTFLSAIGLCAFYGSPVCGGLRNAKQTGQRGMAIEVFVARAQSLRDLALILATEHREEPPLLAFADTEVLEHLKGILQFRRLLGRDAAAFQSPRDFLDVRARKAFRQIHEQ